MLINNRFFSVFRTAARGMEAQRIALGAATENIANAGTSRMADGSSYALKRAVHEAPGTERGNFGSMLTQAGMDVQRLDPRHLSGNSLSGFQSEPDYGPMTEVQETLQLRAEFDPSHPHADPQGYVHYPDVNVVEEMARMVSANRIYEANLTAVQAAKEMIKRTLEI